MKLLLHCRFIAPLVLIGWYIVLNCLNILCLTFLPPPPQPPPAPPVQEDDYTLTRKPKVAGSGRALAAAHEAPAEWLAGNRRSLDAQPALRSSTDGGNLAAETPQSGLAAIQEGNERGAGESERVASTDVERVSAARPSGGTATDSNAVDGMHSGSSDEIAVELPGEKVRGLAFLCLFVFGEFVSFFLFLHQVSGWFAWHMFDDCSAQLVCAWVLLALRACTTRRCVRKSAL